MRSVFIPSLVRVESGRTLGPRRRVHSTANGARTRTRGTTGTEVRIEFSSVSPVVTSTVVTVVTATSPMIASTVVGFISSARKRSKHSRRRDWDSRVIEILCRPQREKVKLTHSAQVDLMLLQKESVLS